MAIPNNIAKAHLLKAIEMIDREGFPNDADSQYYDVVHKGKHYPPKVVVSYANIFANGKPLNRNTFDGGLGTPCFKLLEKHGFIIEPKSYYNELKKFIAQSKTDDKSWKNRYAQFYQGLKVKVSFGQIRAAFIPWISFLAEGQVTSKGSFPVYLLYKKQQKLVLAYGVSETEEPILKWNVDAPTIEDYFKSKGWERPARYGNSYVFKVYDLSKKLDEDTVNSDLDELIGIYKKKLGLKVNNRQQREAKRQTNTNDTDRKTRSGSNLGKKANGAAKPGKAKQGPRKKFDYKEFYNSITDAGLMTTDTQCLRLVASLLAKPFVILTGLSGSGKTRLAQAFAKWICESEDQYRIIPVGADWTNREALFGFPNALEEGKYIMPDSGALRLVLEAAKAENAHKPYFLILDEMNLSHVERYFADFLSAMESGEEIPLHSGDSDWSDVPPALKLPKNLFLIGTVNIDETTYMFSPKVLDRASVIEFRVSADEMGRYLSMNAKMDLDRLDAAGANMAADFLRWAHDSSIKNRHQRQMKDTLLDFFNELKKLGAEFGYRTAAEMNRFAAVASALNADWTADEIMDAVIMQKLLPKVHGSRRKLADILKGLGTLCLDGSMSFDEYQKKGERERNGKIKYPLSFEKIERMYRALLDNGFVSYAEA